MGDQEKTITVKSSYLSLIQLLIAGSIGIGSFLAYTESKYVTRDAHLLEVDQRKYDIADIKTIITHQSEKIDRTYELLLKIKREQ